MKKYLSLKHLVGLLALIAVFGMQSFQNAKDKVAKAEPETMVWFPANAELQEGCEEEDTFNTSNGTTIEPDGCLEKYTFCCAIGYPIEECDHLGGDIYELRQDATSTGKVVRYDPQ